MDHSRRRFLESTTASMALACLGADDPPKLPARAFGKSGLTVSSLGFGSGSRFLMYEAEDAALEALNRAIDRGVTYIDTAHSYGNGRSEERVGKLMSAKRGEVTLATKIPGRKADQAKRQIELSLKRLKTDHLDVLHIHALAGEADLAAIERPDGVLKAMYEARDQKVTRSIGITSHADPLALKLALERHDFDCTQMALNAAMARMADLPGGMKLTPLARGGFEELALPVAVRKGMGVIAMKVFGQDQLPGVSPEKLLTYSLSLPVSLASCGMPRLEFLDKNIEVARAFRPLSDEERRRLVDSIASERKLGMAEFFRDHRDA